MENMENKEFFAVIRWHVDDLKEVLANNGYAVTEQNIQKVLDSRFSRTLQEISIMYGWDIMADALPYVDDLQKGFTHRDGIAQIDILVNGQLFRSCFSPEEVEEAEKEIIASCTNPKYTEVSHLELDALGNLIEQNICSVSHLIDEEGDNE